MESAIAGAADRQHVSQHEVGMSVALKITERVWPALGASIPFLQNQRGASPTPEVRAGINYSVLLGAACYVEGVLESALRALVQIRRDSFFSVQAAEISTRALNNRFFARLATDLETRVGRTTGPEGYDKLFELITGRNLSSSDRLQPTWEGLVVLFHFRNVLAHGRELSAQRTVGPAGAEDQFAGGYAKTESYLVKQKLIPEAATIVELLRAHHPREPQSKGSAKPPQWSEYALLKDAIADHFWLIAEALPEAIAASLEGKDQQACRRAMGLLEGETNGAG